MRVVKTFENCTVLIYIAQDVLLSTAFGARLYRALCLNCKPGAWGLHKYLCTLTDTKSMIHLITLFIWSRCHHVRHPGLHKCPDMQQTRGGISVLILLRQCQVQASLRQFQALLRKNIYVFTHLQVSLRSLRPRRHQDYTPNLHLVQGLLLVEPA